METLKLTVLRNGKEEVVETQCYDIPFETTEKILEVLETDFDNLFVDNNGEKQNIISYLKLTRKVASALKEIRPIMLFIFPELEAKDLNKCSSKEIIKVAMQVILFTLKDCFGELKNDLTAK